MKRFLPFLIVIAVALITFGSGYALYRSKKIAAPSASSGVAGGIHVRGKADAAVTIEEFGDFQCPPCSTMSGVLHKLGEEYGSRLRLIFHHFPLAVHEHAREAAIAAEAAHEHEGESGSELNHDSYRPSRPPTTDARRLGAKDECPRAARRALRSVPRCRESGRRRGA